MSVLKSLRLYLTPIKNNQSNLIATWFGKGFERKLYDRSRRALKWFVPLVFEYVPDIKYGVGSFSFDVKVYSLSIY